MNEENKIDKSLLNDMQLALNVFLRHDDNAILNYLKDNTNEFLDILRTFYNELEIFDEDIEENFKNYMTLNDSLDLCREFLNNYFPQYINEFEDLLNNGTFNFIDKNSEEYETLNEDKNFSFHDAFLDENNNLKENINIIYNHNLNDMFTIIHEFFHHTNSSFKIVKNKMYSTLDRKFYTENISRFIEYLIYDFLKSKENYKEDNIRMIRLLISVDIPSVNDLGYALYIISKMRDIDYSNFYQEYLIDKKEFKIKSKLYDINNKIKNDNTNKKLLEEKELIEEEIKDIEKQNKRLDKIFKRVTESFKYSVGLMLSIIMYYNYKNGIIDLKNIETYNKKIAEKVDLRSINYVLSGELDTEMLLNALNYLEKDINEYENNKLL